ncbi:MAG: hypothetical protein FWF54_09700 [Candidatus Azobacteroides sp.]|nr:hypothetical protein [Candidatus Azobacteroides sp.]
MKKMILTFALFGALFFTANSVSARGIIVYSNGEKIEVVKNLPDSVIIDGKHVNLGVMYKQFSVFWIPMWNYGETKSVLVNDKEDIYYDLTAEDVEMLKIGFNIDVPQEPVIGFWNKIGGKIVWGVVILAVICGCLITRKDDKEAEVPK